MKKVKKMTIKLNLKKLKFQNGEIAQTDDTKSHKGNKNEIMFVEENKPQNNI